MERKHTGLEELAYLKLAFIKKPELDPRQLSEYSIGRY